VTPLDVAEGVRRMSAGRERDVLDRELLEIVKLWLYWEKHVEPPREKLLRELRKSESILEGLR